MTTTEFLREQAKKHPQGRYDISYIRNRVDQDLVTIVLELDALIKSGHVERVLFWDCPYGGVVGEYKSIVDVPAFEECMCCGHEHAADLNAITQEFILTGKEF